MRVTRLPIVVSLASAALCGVMVDIYAWETGRLWLIPALSIVAAAVLVRMARGLPVTNPDHVRPEEVNEVAGAFTSLVRSLRTLFCVVLITIVVVGVASPLATRLADIWTSPWDFGNRVGSSLVGTFVGFAFARMVQVAQSDVSITDLQARLLKAAVARKEAKSFEEDSMQPSAFKTPEGYGKPLQ